jgi:hypothetical protein
MIQRNLFAILERMNIMKKTKEPKSSRFLTERGFRETETRQLIRQRRRQILVHSCLYYHLAASYISDYQFDEWCKELTRLQEKYPKIAAHVEYARDFKDFKVGEAFKLPYTNPEILRKAQQLLEYRNKEKQEPPKKRQLFIPFVRRKR